MTATSFRSHARYETNVHLPEFTGTRVMMMPVRIGLDYTLPPELDHYLSVFQQLSALDPTLPHHGEVGYLTIDERVVPAGSTHRRPGLHVDGVYGAVGGGWGGQGSWGGGRTPPAGGWGGGGSWGGGNGFLTVASRPGCRIYTQEFHGYPDGEGSCEHLREQLHTPGMTLFADEVWWLDPLCVHESIPVLTETTRQFVRLSLPSDAPWFEGYHENPKGVLPTGPILPRRPQMDFA